MHGDLILLILAGGALLVGFLGSFLPVLPGIPLAWVGLSAGPLLRPERAHDKDISNLSHRYALCDPLG